MLVVEVEELEVVPPDAAELEVASLVPSVADDAGSVDVSELEVVPPSPPPSPSVSATSVVDPLSDVPDIDPSDADCGSVAPSSPSMVFVAAPSSAVDDSSVYSTCTISLVGTGGLFP